MKNLYSIRCLLLLLCLCTSYFIRAQEAIYVYRNDGQFHAFFNDEIDSIAYSNVDTLGISHEKIVVQEVYALDSIYRIPISAIDSVSFHAPVPVFRPDVKLLNSAYASYVVSIEDSTIIFDTSLSSPMRPKIGDVLVTEYPNPYYPLQFSGRVAEIQNTSEGLKYLCNSVELTDIYERLVVLGKSRSIQENTSQVSVRKSATQIDNGFFSINNLHISVPIELDQLNLHLDIDPKQIELRYSVIVENNKKTVTWIRTSQSTTVTVGADIKWENSPKDKEPWVKKSDEINNLLKKLRLPLEVPIFTGVTGFVELRPVLEFRADASLGLTWSFTSTTTDDVYRDANNKITHKSIEKTFNPDIPKVQASIDGEICAGCGIKIGLGGIKRSITSIGADVKLLGVISGNAHFEFSPIEIYDTYIYDAFKDSKVSIGVRAEIVPFATFLTFSTEDLFNETKEEETRNPLELSVEYNLWEFYLFPDFSDFISQINGSRANLQIDASRQLIWPSARVGIGIFDELDRIVGESFYEYNWGTTQLHLNEDFTLHQGYAYDCYPLVQVQWGDHYLGIIKASPQTRIVLNPAMPAKITNFEQNNATFNRDGFEYKGNTYYYDFAATTTVELENSEGVVDWGYVYIDPYGEADTISVAGLGSNPAKDTRYHYYRDIPNATATLYGYSKYADGTFVFDEPKDYDLVYTFHPTAYVGDVIADNITTTTAQFEYRFNDVPRTGKCYIAYQAQNEEEPKIQQVPYAEKETTKVIDLHHATTYDYWAYVEYAGITYSSEKKTFTTKTLPSPVAITGDCSNVTKNSATVSCTYENVPKGGICGVEYTWTNSSKKQSIGNANGTQTITISDLKSGTTYSYRAYVEVYGQTFYGEERSFSTKNEVPDITGTWHCSDYDMDGKVSGEATFKLTKEGKVYRSDVSGSGGDCDDPGQWSINENGWVHIIFEHVNTNGSAWEKSYGGDINSFDNPSTIEGTATKTYYGTNGGYSQTKYSFAMSR